MTPQDIEIKLERLLKKLTLTQPVTVDDIKDIIWNAERPSGSSELFFRLTEHEKRSNIN